MNEKALFKLSYGLFVLTARKDTKDNGCIINTVFLVTSEPNCVSICVNKAAYTHDMINDTGKFTVSVISEKATFDLFKRFGMQSGADTDKFEGFDGIRRGKNGICYVSEGTNAYISVKVEKTVDLGTHTMFIGPVTDMEVLSDAPSVTYDYYRENIKPVSGQGRVATEANQKDTTVWRCSVCGFEYVGEKLPEDIICPLCKHTAAFFEKAEN